MMEFIRVREVRVVPPYTLWLRMSDGAEGFVDLTQRLHGPVFGPLNDAALFAQVALDDIAYTVCWPNGADLAPEYLREHLSSGTTGRVAEHPAP